MSRPANELQRVFNLRPNTPGKLLLPAVQGTMDVSQTWPLGVQINRFDYTAAAGTNLVNISSPPNGFHELVSHAWFTTNTPAAGKSSVLFLANLKVPGGPGNVTLQRVNLDALSQVPLINGFYFQTGTVVLIEGLKAVYVPPNFALQHAYIGAAAADAVTLRTESMRLPDSQPFSSLLEMA